MAADPLDVPAVTHRVIAGGRWAREERALRAFARRIRAKMGDDGPRSIRFTGNVLATVTDGTTLIDVAGFLDAPTVTLPISRGNLSVEQGIQLHARGALHRLTVLLEDGLPIREQE